MVHHLLCNRLKLTSIAVFTDSQKELDMKLGEFSQRIFALFTQDPDDIQTLRMAEDMISHEKKYKHKKKSVVSN